MDEKDREILNEIQSAFPIVSRPYAELGARLGLKEEEVLDRVVKLRKSGVIRRIGANFHSNRLDFSSTLCAARVPKEKLELFVRKVNSYPGVTHNYLRPGNYNVWFTFIAPDMISIENALRDIEAETGVEKILNLPALRLFKIKVDFEI
ncbi:MAG: AsnC family transcriptional regulator [Desulfatiglandaceae bacterium]